MAGERKPDMRGAFVVRAAVGAGWDRAQPQRHAAALDKERDDG